jgi:hypothetical protein
VVWHVKVENFHLMQSLHHYEHIPNSGEIVLSTVPRCVFILCVLRLPINCGNYIYWRVIQYGSLLVVTVFVWAKLKVEVCLVVFLLRLVAQ